MTMTTVGYGDITPKNNLERLTANITMFLACGVFAFSINSIGIVLQNLYKNKMEYRLLLTFPSSFIVAQSLSSTISCTRTKFSSLFKRESGATSNTSGRKRRK